MDQSRSRFAHLKPPLIHAPELQARKQHILFMGITLLFWGAWIYLWVPVIALLAWLLGIQQAYKYMIVLGGYHAVLDLLIVYSIGIAVLGGALLCWAGYNIFRFTGIERRMTGLPITAEQLGLDFMQSPGSVMHWQTQKRLLVSHDEMGGIRLIEVLPNQ